MEKQEWETATRLCAGAMAVPPDIVDGVFAERTVVRPLKFYTLALVNRYPVVSRRQNFTFPLQNLLGLLEYFYATFSWRTSSKPLVLGTQQQLAVSSSCFLPLVGTKRAWARTPLLLWISFAPGHRYPLKVRLSICLLRYDFDLI